MKLRTRVLTSSLAALMLAAACGAGTGEAPASPSAAATTATATAAPVAAKLVTPLVMVGDTIRGKLGLNETEVQLQGPGLHCTQQSRFPQGGRIVWRMKVLDPVTGKYLDDKDLASFTITYPDGKSDKLAYGEHKGASGSDFLWAVGYTVPLDYPTGAFNVKIEARAGDGRVATFDQFKVSFAQLQITAKDKDYPRY